MTLRGAYGESNSRAGRDEPDKGAPALRRAPTRDSLPHYDILNRGRWRCPLAIDTTMEPADLAQGIRLRDLRVVRWFKTATSLGKEAGVGRRTILAYEAGSGELSPGELVKLADALEVSVDVLLGRGPMPPSNMDEIDVLRFCGAANGENLEVAEDESSHAVLEVFLNMHSDDSTPIWSEMNEGDPMGSGTARRG